MVQRSASAARILSVLDFFAGHPGQSFTLTDVIRSLKLSRSTAHVLLNTLCDGGYLFRASDKTYILGAKIVAISRTAASHFSPLALARPKMRQLADRFGAVCSALARRDEMIIVLDRAVSGEHLGWALTHEVQRPFSAPYADVFMAWEDPSEIECWLGSLTPALTDAQIRNNLAAMAGFRELGFAVVRTNRQEVDDRPVEEIASGMDREIILEPHIDPAALYVSFGITAPVFDEAGRCEFALSLIAFSAPHRGDELLHIGRILREACDEVSSYFMPRRLKSFAGL